MTENQTISNVDSMQQLITVITVVFNGAKNLRQTIESVIAQDYSNIEYVVIDGGSNDGSVDIIRKYSHLISYWVSESDSGIADAMNKGIRAATGDYVLFLHADDYFVGENALSSALAMVGNNDFPILAFNILFKQGTTLSIKKPRPYNKWTLFKNPFPHQGALCQRRLFDQIGFFDTNSVFTMDYDFFLKAYYRGVKVARFDYAPVVMRDNGISSCRDWNVLRRRLSEERQVQQKNCDSTMMLFLYRLYWLCYLPYRYVRSQLGVLFRVHHRQ